MFHPAYFSIEHYKELILSFLSQQLYLAPIFLVFIEEVGFPLSIADFIIAYTGYQVAQGHISFWIAFVLILIADLLGASVLFFLSRKYGETIIKKFGKYINLDHKKLDTLKKYFKKYGLLVIIVGRHLPGMRIPTILFAGISKMNYFIFIGSTAISVFIWIYFYLTLGMRLGPKTIELLHVHGLDILLVLLPIILFLIPFFFLRKKRKNPRHKI